MINGSLLILTVTLLADASNINITEIVCSGAAVMTAFQAGLQSADPLSQGFMLSDSRCSTSAFDPFSSPSLESTSTVDSATSIIINGTFAVSLHLSPQANLRLALNASLNHLRARLAFVPLLSTELYLADGSQFCLECAAGSMSLVVAILTLLVSLLL